MSLLENYRGKIARLWANTQSHKIEFHEKYFFACVALLVLSCSFYFFDDLNSIALKADATTPVFSGGGLSEGNDILKDELSDVGVIEADSLIDTIVWAIKWVLILSGILAVVAFIWAGVLYITSFLNEENNETAKKVMIYAVIGIVIIIFSWTIVNFLTTFEL